MNDIHGKSRKKESNFKATGQVKQNHRQGQDKEVNQSNESITQGLKQKNNFKNRKTAHHREFKCLGKGDLPASFELPVPTTNIDFDNIRPVDLGSN